MPPRARRPSGADRARATATPRSGRGPGPAEGSCAARLEAGLLQPLRHRVGRKAELAMRVLVAQEFGVVRREVDHQQAALRPQQPRRLADRAAPVVEEMQHLVHDDDVEESRGTRRSKMSPWRTLQCRRAFCSSGRRRACDLEHVGVDAETAPGRVGSAGPNSSRMRPVPVPRSSRERNGRSPSSAQISASTASSPACRRRMQSHSAAGRGNNPGPPPREPRARQRAARGRGR